MHTHGLRQVSLLHNFNTSSKNISVIVTSQFQTSKNPPSPIISGAHKISKMMSFRKVTSGALCIDETDKVEDSLVGFLSHQLPPLVKPQEFCLQDFQMMIPSSAQSMPRYDVLCALDNVDNALFDIDKANESTRISWGFMRSSSIDLEPTPIKPDLLLRQEEPNAANKEVFPTTSLCTPILPVEDRCSIPGSSIRASTTTSLLCTPILPVEATDNHLCTSQQQSSISSSSSRLPTKDVTKKKRKSKHPVFRSYQTHQFQEQYEELLRFKEEHGHCLVPHMYKENISLSRWVKRQRYQYKLMVAGNSESTMTKERIAMLEAIGFVWDSHKLAWEDRLKELKDYKEAYGDCNVPSSYPPNPALAIWVREHLAIQTP